jgi:hypothetical protein
MLLELLIATVALIWAPFIWATATGKHVSIPLYLAVHLSCILTDVWLKWRGAGTPPKSGLFQTQKLGNLMIWMGIGAWVPYFLIKIALEPGLSVQAFLSIHLSGIFDGILVRLRDGMYALKSCVAPLGIAA